MNELSLFTGAGGGVLGSKILGWRTIGYVEYEKYCQEIIKQRIADGILDAAPIFGDIRKFISDGYAEQYHGIADLVTGGFPCQPFSVAGKQAGENDPRNMWPKTIECIRIIRPRFAFLENVPGLLSLDYFGRVLGDLSEAGYHAKWIVLGADDVGANHRRKRLWILAYSNSSGDGRRIREAREAKSISRINWQAGQLREFGGTGEISADVAHARCNTAGSAHGGGIGGSDGHGKDQREGRGVRDDIADGGEAMAYSEVTGQQRSLQRQRQVESSGGNSSGSECSGKWWKSEPNVGRVAHGIPRRVDRLKAIGNGQVPLSMAYAFSILSQGIIE